MTNEKDDREFKVKLPEAKAKKLSLDNVKSQKQESLRLRKSTVDTQKSRSEMARELESRFDEVDEYTDAELGTPIGRGIAFGLDIFFLMGVSLFSFYLSKVFHFFAHLFMDKYRLKFIFANAIENKIFLTFSVILCLVLFIVVPLSFFNTSFGKKMAGLKVRGEDFYSIPLSKAFMRELIFKPISVLLMVGLFLPFFNKKKKSLHDYLAKTVVIRQ